MIQTESGLKKAESLNQGKGKLKSEKFKSSAAEADSALMDGISSALGTSKVKRQQQEIETLKAEKEKLQLTIDRMTDTKLFSAHLPRVLLPFHAHGHQIGYGATLCIPKIFSFFDHHIPSFLET